MAATKRMISILIHGHVEEDIDIRELESRLENFITGEVEPDACGIQITIKTSKLRRGALPTLPILMGEEEGTTEITETPGQST